MDTSSNSGFTQDQILLAAHGMSSLGAGLVGQQELVSTQAGAFHRGHQKTLWIGDLAPWMDEEFLYSVFSPTKQLVSVKIIRNKATGASEGYAFLEMSSYEAAEQVLQVYNGRNIPGTSNMSFRLNWAAYGVGRTSQPTQEDHSLFVGDLAPDVSDLILQEYFRQFYPSVRSAKVITDAATGRSKGYGFVRFSAENERNIALMEMNGHFLSHRPIRVSLATAKKNLQSSQVQNLQPLHPSDLDPTNTTLFIGGLSSQVLEDQLRAIFSQFGDIIYVKIPQGKGCGFVQYVLRASAETAMMAMNGKILGNSAMRISWGRSSSRSPSQQNLNGSFQSFGSGSLDASLVSGFQQNGFSSHGLPSPLTSLPSPSLYATGQSAVANLPSADLLARTYARDGTQALISATEQDGMHLPQPHTLHDVFHDSRRTSMRASTELDSLLADGSNHSNPSDPGSHGDIGLHDSSLEAASLLQRESHSSRDGQGIFGNIVA